jgi:hypothetical protein
MAAPEPTLYYWEEKGERIATLAFDPGYKDDGEPIGFIYVYKLDRSRPARELADEIRALGPPNLKWRLMRS